MTLLLKKSGQLAIHHHLARTCQSQLPTLSSIIAAPTPLLFMTHPTLLYVLCSPNILDLISFSFRNWYKNWRQQKLKNPNRNPSCSPLHHHRKLLVPHLIPTTHSVHAQRMQYVHTLPILCFVGALPRGAKQTWFCSRLPNNRLILKDSIGDSSSINQYYASSLHPSAHG